LYQVPVNIMPTPANARELVVCVAMSLSVLRTPVKVSVGSFSTLFRLVLA
jgi:hypothetical protein